MPPSAGLELTHVADRSGQGRGNDRTNAAWWHRSFCLCVGSHVSGYAFVAPIDVSVELAPLQLCSLQGQPRDWRLCIAAMMDATECSAFMRAAARFVAILQHGFGSGRGDGARRYTESMHALIESHCEQLLSLARRRGVTSVRVFGSMVRGGNRESSDVDLLVTLAPGTSALALGGLLLDAQELLGRRVDVVTEASLHPALRDRVLADAVPL